MNKLIEILDLEINARQKEYHPHMRVQYKNNKGLEERWRAPTFVDLIDEDIDTFEMWTKKIRIAILNMTSVCLVSNNPFYLLNSKLLPLSNYFILCYTKYWYDNLPVYIVLFNYESISSSLKTYGFCFSPIMFNN